VISLNSAIHTLQQLWRAKWEGRGCFPDGGVTEVDEYEGIAMVLMAKVPIRE